MDTAARKPRGATVRALSDSQLQAIWHAAHGLPPEKRGVYLERMIAWLQFRGGGWLARQDAATVAHESRGKS
jgi:hypothetical protein